MVRYAVLLFLFTLFIANGCKKSYEDSDEYKRLIKYQEQMDEKTDSLRRSDYQKTLDSSNKKMKREIDSLHRNADSIEKEIEKNIKKSK
jgi:uncharacterized protein YlxW (UPF0749 family)